MNETIFLYMITTVNSQMICNLETYVDRGRNVGGSQWNCSLEGDEIGWQAVCCVCHCIISTSIVHIIVPAFHPQIQLTDEQRVPTPAVRDCFFRVCREVRPFSVQAHSDITGNDLISHDWQRENQIILTFACQTRNHWQECSAHYCSMSHEKPTLSSLFLRL